MSAGKSILGSAIVAAGAVFMLLSGSAHSQAFPARPIRIVSPVPAGVGPEVEMRQIAARLGTILGQSVVVENRPGAAGRLATDAVIKSQPDGHTLLLTSPTTVLAEFIYANSPYDTKKDLAAVSLVSSTAFALYVSADSAVQNVAQLIEQAKTKPGTVTMGTYGEGSTHHMTGAWLEDVTGAKLRYIHYQTSTPYNDVARQEVNAVFESVLPVLGLVQSGKLRAIAVAGKARHRQLPNVPTFAEAGLPQFDPIVWSALTAPARTPPAIIEKLSAAIAEVVKNPEFVSMSRDRSREAIGSTPRELEAFLDRERSNWSVIVKKAGIRIE